MAANEQFVIRLGLNASGVAAGVNSATGQIQRLYGDVQNVVRGLAAAAVVRWTAGIVKDAIELGSHLNDLADRSNTSVEKFQMWQHAINQSGGSVEGLTKSLKDMAKAQIEALKGNAELRASFQRYGISLDDLRKLKPDDLFDKLAEGLGTAQATAQVTDDVAKLLGKAGDEMLPAFRNGFAETAKEAENLGLVLKRDVTDELDRAGDELDILTDRFKKLTASVTASSIRGIRDTLTEISSTIVGGDFGAAAKKAMGGGTTGDIVGAIISRFVKSAIVGQSEADDEAERQRRANRHQEAPGNNVRKEGEGNLAPNFKPDSDALARIGGNRGGVSEVQRTQTQQLGELRLANRYLQRIAHYSEAGLADGVRDPQTRALLQRVDYFLRFGEGEDM